eukprot:10871553-Alexandrium_andersonii.AAC.1
MPVALARRAIRDLGKRTWQQRVEERIRLGRSAPVDEDEDEEVQARVAACRRIARARLSEMQGS